jgi:D-alanyl-D-alanine carboxypeptidase/D-alanyl-D-alanine-endopeptidase (penicillin-binding protein 4)
MTRRSVLFLVFIAFFLGSGQVGARGPEPLAARLSAMVAQAGLGDGIGVHVIRLYDGKSLYNSRADEPRNPASNMKLLTAAVALRRLGPSFEIATSAEGKLDQGRVTELVLRARGDPTLTYSKLIELGEALRLRGVDRIDRIVIDDSYFDSELLPPAFEQQPHEDAAFRAPVAAFSVNRNSYAVYIAPGDQPGAPGRVRVLADGHIRLDNQTQTRDRGASRIIIEHVVTEDGNLAVEVSGGVSNRAGMLRFGRRVPDPRAHAASLLRRAFRNSGIEGELTVSYDPHPQPLPVITSLVSPPLSEMLYGVGKWSDNFTAEMLLKIIGAEAERPGSSAGGARVVKRELQAMGVDTEGLVVTNGSGLFDGNRVTPRQIGQVLAGAYRDPRMQAEYLAQLALAGQDGTLKRRLQDLPASVSVRAKTGTLRDTIALSGYVLGSPERSLAFSFVANGVAGRQMAARRLADEIVTKLAEYAEEAPPPVEQTTVAHPTP